MFVNQAGWLRQAQPPQHIQTQERRLRQAQSPFQTAYMEFHPTTNLKIIYG